MRTHQSSSFAKWRVFTTLLPPLLRGSKIEEVNVQVSTSRNPLTAMAHFDETTFFSYWCQLPTIQKSKASVIRQTWLSWFPIFHPNGVFHWLDYMKKGYQFNGSTAITNKIDPYPLIKLEHSTRNPFLPEINNPK